VTRHLIYVSLLCAVAGAARPARAEPYLAIRTGMRCSQCHVNRSGGGGRNDFGNVYAQTRLAMRSAPFRSRALGDLASLSADVRAVASAAVGNESPRTAFDLGEANVMVESRLIDDKLAVYLDEIVGPTSASAREAFVLLERLPLDGYVKAGKFLLPYGLRLLDDAEFIRQRTGFSYDTPDQGVEFGLEPGRLSLFVAVTNGTQGAPANKNQKQVTASAALVYPRFRIGASASRNDGPTSRRDVLGGFGGLGLGRLTLLGEVDVIADAFPTSPDVRQLAAFVEGDFLAARGLNAKVTYGFLDPNRDIGENARYRMRFGVEAFPLPFLQLAAFYTLVQDIPQATTDVDHISLEWHVYF
jgi:hypothetical protein